MNPILQQLNQSRNMMTNMNSMLSLLKGNPSALMQQMQHNPMYQKFLADNAGKTTEQIAQENGINIGFVRNLLKR